MRWHVRCCLTRTSTGTFEDLAGLAVPEREMPIDDMLPRLQRLADAVVPNIASIYDVHFDFLVWNTPYATGAA